MNDVILDSWIFQCVGELFENGYDRDTTQALVATEAAHEYVQVVYGEIQLQALADMLSHVVLRDTLQLDRQFIDAWEVHVDAFKPISDAGLVLVTTPIIAGTEVTRQRQRIVQDLCVTPTLRDMQAENEASFDQRGESIKPYESQIMWGGAGMLARSYTQRIPYMGHPLRQRFIESTKAWRPLPDPTRTVLDLVNDQKVAVWSTVLGQEQATRATLMIPAIAAEVVSKARYPAELFPIALELRDKYSKLREWLGEMRMALQEEDTAKLMLFKRTLNALAKDVARTTGTGDTPMATLDITVGFLSVSIPVPDVMSRISSRLSVRHDLMKMVKTPVGEQSLVKLGAMFGKPSTASR